MLKNTLLETLFEKKGIAHTAGRMELLCVKIAKNRRKYIQEVPLLLKAPSKKLIDNAERKAMNSKTVDNNIMYKNITKYKYRIFILSKK